MKGQNKLFIAIIIALVVGVILGGIIHFYASESNIESFASKINLLGTLFIRLVQMIIAPLVFTTLVVGIGKMGDMKMVGRVGGKAMAWFISASLISLLIGMFWVNVLAPGEGTEIAMNVSDAGDLLQAHEELSLDTFLNHVVPRSVFEAFAQNEILQIVVFSIFFGLALAAYGKKGQIVTEFLDRIAHIVLIMVNYVMWTAPLGVLGAVAAATARYGFEIFSLYAHYLLAFSIGIITLWVVLLGAGYWIMKRRMTDMVTKHIKAPLLVAFSTTSSEAVFPILMEELEKFGVQKRIVSFTLPLGYSFNLDGSMMYMTFAALFIAQVYGIHMPLSEQLLMLLVLMLTSKGVAGVPRASLIVVVATCAMFGIPPEGIALILPIDHFCDMARSMTNVLGNSIATAAVDKWEGHVAIEKEVMQKAS